MGQWAMRSDGSWHWDPTAADPSVTRMMSAYAGGSPMSDMTPRPDNGGLVSYSPENPHDPTLDEALTDGPASWTGSDPAVSRPETWATAANDLVVCPCCGTGVHPDRIRE